jgi:hypothetical protein
LPTAALAAAKIVASRTDNGTSSAATFLSRFEPLASVQRLILNEAHHATLVVVRPTKRLVASGSGRGLRPPWDSAAGLALAGVGARGLSEDTQALRLRLAVRDQDGSDSGRSRLPRSKVLLPSWAWRDRLPDAYPHSFRPLD